MRNRSIPEIDREAVELHKALLSPQHVALQHIELEEYFKRQVQLIREKRQALNNLMGVKHE